MRLILDNLVLDSRSLRSAFDVLLQIIVMSRRFFDVLSRWILNVQCVSCLGESTFYDVSDVLTRIVAISGRESRFV